MTAPSTPNDAGKWRYTLPGNEPIESLIVWDERGFAAIYIDGHRQLPVHMLDEAIWERIDQPTGCALAHKVQTGDRGQRYEIWCDDEDGQPMQIGWANDPSAFSSTVELHPCWKNHRAVDRHNGGTEP